MGVKQLGKRALLASLPRKKLTVLHQLFRFLLRKKISIDSLIFSAMTSKNSSEKIPSGP